MPARRRTKKKGSLRPRTLPALEISYNETSFYLTAMTAQDLFAVSVVSRAEEDPEQGYQRTLGKGRAKVIAQYFDDGKVIPGSIILSAQDEAQLSFDNENRTLSFMPTERAFLVIDGQHRLFGAHLAESNVILPCCIFAGLDTASEVEYFLDVNGEQRGVPRTLQLEITKLLDDVPQKEEQRHRLFHELDRRPDSPLCGRMTPHRPARGKISHVPFKAALDPLLNRAPLRELNFDQKVELLVSFLRAVERVLIESLGDSQKLVNGAFFQALFGAFRDILEITFRQHGNYWEESIRKTVEPLSGIDWDAHKGSNKKVIGELTDHIVALVTRAVRVSDDLLKPPPNAG